MILLSQTTTHMTGVLTRLGYEIPHNNWWRIAVDLTTWFGYFSGIILGAAILGPNAKLSLYKKRYMFAVCFLIEWLLLLAARVSGDNEWVPTPSNAMMHPDFLSKFCIALANGIHNSTTTVYSGGPGRTGHLTGTK